MLQKSKNFKEEYCCSVVKIGPILPIEGADKIGKTLVNGVSIVVRKDQVSEGDILVYASNESQLDANFLKVNNLFDCKEMNENPEVKGYFNKHGRVRMITLKGCPSMGYLTSFEELHKYDPNLKKEELVVGTDFDMINDKLFVKAYIPEIHVRNGARNNYHKPEKRFNRIIPEEFKLHYDTSSLAKNISLIDPNAKITISVKCHGENAVISHCKVKQPIFSGLYTKYFNKLPKFLQFTKIGYDVVYSSHKVIRNAFVNSVIDTESEFTKYYLLLKNIIPKNITIYGEIVGFKPSGSAIQKGYDYGCISNQNKLYIFRITEKVNNNVKEYNMTQVVQFVNSLLETNPELQNDIKIIPILYQGNFCDLYNDICLDDNWCNNVLERLKTDKNLGMEENEQLCQNKVPREGIVLRIDDDVIPRAFKLKTMKFLGKEAKDYDQGIVDQEALENYG